MNLKKVGSIIILGLLLGCEANKVQQEFLEIGEVPKEVIENTQETIAVMQNSEGLFMDVVYLGEGVFAFFHPETKEFQSGSVDTSKTVSLDYENQTKLDEYMLKMIEDLYGKDSVQFQSLKNHTTH